MAERSEKRIGYGEPMTLSAADADLLRDYFSGKSLTDSEYDSLELALFPRPAVCVAAQRVIQAAADYFANLESLPVVGDDDYDGQGTYLSNVITMARNAFEERPAECEMRVGNDDNYDCDRCRWDAHLAI